MDLSEKKKVGIAGPGQEIPRQEQAIFGMADARQSLGADHVARAQIELRLIPEFQPIPPDGFAEVDFRIASRDHQVLYRADGRGQRHQPLPFDDPPQRVEAEWLGQDRQHLQPATRADPADVVEQRRLAAAHDLDRAAIADARQLAQGVDRIRIAKEEIEKDDLGRAVTEDFEHRRSAGEMLSRDAEAGQRGGHQPADRGFIVEDEAERSRGCPGLLRNVREGRVIRRGARYPQLVHEQYVTEKR